MTDRPKTAPYTRPIPEYGDLMTVDEYIGAVNCGGFIDYDGNGIAARDGLCDGRNSILEDHVAIFPSDGLTYIPEDATHIVWFNK